MVLPFPMVSWRAGRVTVLCLAAGALVLSSAPMAAASGTPAWTAHAFPSFPDPGCVKSAWAGDKIYVVRTPLCNLDDDQVVTFESYDPATGATELLAQLPAAAAQATVKELDGR